MKQCTVVGCITVLQNARRGWCNKHYNRWYAHGNPLAKPLQERHGEYGSPTYYSWQHMKSRCYNPNNINYKNYGGRGITVCDQWRNSFAAFFADMGERPEGLTLDRINNDGNYEASNCKWSTRSEQCSNRRYRNKHGYKGIEFDKERQQWRAKITIDGKKCYLGRFDTLERAIHARKMAETNV